MFYEKRNRIADGIPRAKPKSLERDDCRFKTSVFIVPFENGREISLAMV
jgi:hypothetical protein